MPRFTLTSPDGLRYEVHVDRPSELDEKCQGIANAIGQRIHAAAHGELEPGRGAFRMDFEPVSDEPEAEEPVEIETKLHLLGHAITNEDVCDLCGLSGKEIATTQMPCKGKPQETQPPLRAASTVQGLGGGGVNVSSTSSGNDPSQGRN